MEKKLYIIQIILSILILIELSIDMESVDKIILAIICLFLSLA